MLAITKSDLLDDELRKALAEELPDDIPHLFISSVTGAGIAELKDLLWNELNRETFHDAEQIVHRDMDMRFVPIDDEEDWEIPAVEEEELPDDPDLDEGDDDEALR